jgi:thiol:disulfide interchange protein
MRHIRYTPLILLLFIITSFIGSDRNITTALTWYNIEEAQKRAKDSPKMVFIDFTAKWCGWCKVMDKKTFTDPEVADYLNQYFYSVKIDFDSPKKFIDLGT